MAGPTLSLRFTTTRRSGLECSPGSGSLQSFDWGELPVPECASRVLVRGLVFAQRLGFSRGGLVIYRAAVGSKPWLGATLASGQPGAS